jgi:lipoprotein-anchoring transpeptidase ErfK/SrfK
MLVLSGLVAGWSELYVPLGESLKTDVLGLARELLGRRREIGRLEGELPRLGDELREQHRALSAMTAKFPTGLSADMFMVVNTSANRLTLRRGKAVLLEAGVSTGSNDTLVSGARRWVFETPRGVRTVINKRADPVWNKPDWAFLEAGEPVPPYDSPLRRVHGPLGAYALYLGAGIMIHGTDKEHLLGQSVTHGCIRAAKDDIKFLYDSVPLGTRVYIH